VPCAVLHPVAPAPAPGAAAPVLHSVVAQAPVAPAPAVAVSPATATPGNVGAISNVLPDGTAASITLDDPLFANSDTTSSPITRPKASAQPPQVISPQKPSCRLHGNCSNSPTTSPHPHGANPSVLCVCGCQRSYICSLLVYFCINTCT
jgi:hypothetical protein